MILKRLRRNKKGVLGLDGLVNGVTSFFQTIMSTVPKPVLFIIFLFLLVVAGWVFSIGFQIAGVYCNSADQPVKLDGFLSGIALLGEVPDPQTINTADIDDVNNFQAITIEDCSQYIEDGTITYPDGTKERLLDRYVYRDNGRCTECVLLGEVRENRTGLNIRGTYCADSRVIRKDPDDLSVLGKLTCGGNFIGACQPPEHYYFDRTLNKYVCADETCETLTHGRVWDEKLRQKGAKLLYPYATDEINPSSDHFVGAVCTDLKPKVGVFGVDLFSFEIWVFLTLIILLFWGATKLSVF